MNENETRGIVVDVIKVPMQLGPSLLESVYETALFYDSSEVLTKEDTSAIINHKLT